MPDQRLIDIMPLSQAISFLMTLIFIQPMFQLLTLLITASSSFFLIRGVIKLSPLEMAKMSGAHLDLNPKIGENFAKQKADTVIGFILLIVSLIIQTWIISQPLRLIDTGGLGIIHIIFVLVIFAAICLNAELYRCRLINKYLTDFKQGLEQSLK